MICNCHCYLENTISPHRLTWYEFKLDNNINTIGYLTRVFLIKYPSNWQKMTFCDLTIPLLDSDRSIKPTVVPIVAYTKIELHKMKIFQFNQEKAFFPLSHTFTPEGCPVQSQFDWNSWGVMHQHQQPTLGEGRNEASHSPTCPAALLIKPVTL